MDKQGLVLAGPTSWHREMDEKHSKAVEEYKREPKRQQVDMVFRKEEVVVTGHVIDLEDPEVVVRRGRQKEPVQLEID